MDTSKLNDNKINMSQMEDLAINSIEECRQIINNHIEKFILSKINEKDFIIKKTRMAGKKDRNNYRK